MKVPASYGVADEQLREVVVRNDLRSAKQPEDLIMRELSRAGYDSDTIFAIKLALEEAMTNAVKHGNGMDAAKHVTVRFFIDRRRCIIMVRDEGPGFVPERIPDCTADENLERPSGRGILLMQSYMNHVCYSAEGNEVWMMKLNPAARD